MTHETILAGFGGQGILFAAKLLAYCGMVCDKELSWLPSYGPEMRGGTCNCHVIISDEPVSSPLITEPTALIAMNLPSLDKFEGMVKAGGAIVYDSSLCAHGVSRTDVTAVAVPATQMAMDMEKPKLANMIMVGALLRATGMVSFEVLEQALKQVTPAAKPELYDMNLAFLKAGYDYQN